MEPREKAAQPPENPGVYLFVAESLFDLPAFFAGAGAAASAGFEDDSCCGSCAPPNGAHKKTASAAANGIEFAHPAWDISSLPLRRSLQCVRSEI